MRSPLLFGSRLFASSLVLSLGACDGGGGGAQGGAAGQAGMGGEGGAPGGMGGMGGGGAGGTNVICGTADVPLPPGLVDVTWDDGSPDSNLREQNLQITVNNIMYLLNEEELYEAVRFDLEHPARIHGFTVHWAGLPDGLPPTTELRAGLYGDFGHNGFDFWEPDPLWEGTRCTGELGPEGQATYVFDAPIEVTHPGLVYVAHHADVGEPVFAFDGSTQGDGTCAAWDDCHSSINMPKVQKSQFYNGVTFPFQYDYLVTLHVEYTDDLTPAERFFQPAPFSGSYAHASFGDYDGDGWDDLLTDGPTLHKNQGDGTFADATVSSGIAAMGIAGTGGVFGDYDNDGCLDLFVYAESYTAADSLLHSNCDGTFTNVTALAGITDVQAYEDCNDPVNNVRSPTAGAAWIDLDADGFLDLYEANFICWDKGTNYDDRVWHNEGNGTFVEWTQTHGFLKDQLATRGANAVDLDADGDVDLYAHNYRLNPNQYYRNLGGGQFEEVAEDLGLAGVWNVGNYYGHTIGTAIGDLNADGRLDVVVANLAHPRFFKFSDKTQILMQQADGTFQDAQGLWAKPETLTGLLYQETHSVPALADFDHDGDLDLIITAVYDGRPTDFYFGNGDGTFTLDAYHAGITTENGWGVALADWDHDGDVDVFATTPFENMRSDPGHWLQVRAVGGVTANWAAIGATVRVTAGGKTYVRYVQGGTGKGGQDSMYLHFGLGSATQVTDVEVTYPGGLVVNFGAFAADQRVWVMEDGTTHLGWGPPP